MAGDVAMDDELLGREEDTTAVDEQNGGRRPDGVDLRQTGEGGQWMRRAGGGVLAGKENRDSEVLLGENVQRDSGERGWPGAMDGEGGRMTCDVVGGLGGKGGECGWPGAMNGEGGSNACDVVGGLGGNSGGRGWPGERNGESGRMAGDVVGGLDGRGTGSRGERGREEGRAVRQPGAGAGVAELTDRWADWALLEEEGAVFMPGGEDDGVEGGGEGEEETWRVVGRFLTQKLIKLDFMRQVLTSVWQPVRGIQVTEIQRGLFLFVFFDKTDLDYVLNGGPWAFENNALVCREVLDEVNPVDVELDMIDMWVPLHDMPKGYTSHAILE
ncbi:PREDICTED: uncharacterized protein LOC109156508 [Ipomoea nil]|uniref:uncharacterized protein LOC109156508 n=1 Tax=Ipomoea nil TaxID=35883 RepID=UPI000901DFF6|nr:PREDICTED: uncharacterized protein LOC109156508 [Ipomoea nil]